MIDRWTLATVLAMAVATYLTRIGGYLLLNGRVLSPGVMAVLDTAPGCVLIAVIAPAFVSGRLADIVALATTLVAAARLPLLPTVMIAVGSAGLLRHAFG